MRISDWSSDVCSSDLRAQRRRGAAGARAGPPRGHDRGEAGVSGRRPSRIVLAVALFALSALYAAWFHDDRHRLARSEEHTSELQSLMRISYAVFCLQKKKNNTHNNKTENTIMNKQT